MDYILFTQKQNIFNDQLLMYTYIFIWIITQ